MPQAGKPGNKSVREEVTGQPKGADESNDETKGVLWKRKRRVRAKRDGRH